MSATIDNSSTEDVNPITCEANLLTPVKTPPQVGVVQRPIASKNLKTMAKTMPIQTYTESSDCKYSIN
jgi:hypothetical protein